jgi:hypothetical protein
MRKSPDAQEGYLLQTVPPIQTKSSGRPFNRFDFQSITQRHWDLPTVEIGGAKIEVRQMSFQNFYRTPKVLQLLLENRFER